MGLGRAQELRLAGISTLEDANQFLRERYIREFNGRFTEPAKEKGTAFRKIGRADLEWIFSVQHERVVAKDNTVTMGPQCWQIGKTTFKNSLAGCTVTIHEHLDGKVSIRYGPMWLVVTGRRECHRGRGAPWKRRSCGSRGKPKAGFPRLPQLLGNLAQDARFPLSRRAGCIIFRHQDEADRDRILIWAVQKWKSESRISTFAPPRQPQAQGRKSGQITNY